MATTRRRLAFTLSLMVASFALATPAGAQVARGPAVLDYDRLFERVQFRDFWDDRGWSYRNNSPGSFWGGRRPSYPNRSYDPYTPYRRQQAYESIKPPAPRKTETPPAEMVVVIGDSFAEWLAYGLEEVFAETPQIGIVRKTKQDLGLVRDDPRLDAPEWTQAIKDLLPATEKPNAIVVMLGVNDRAPLRERPPPAKEAASSSDNAHPGPATAGAPRQPPSASYEFHTDKWAELYSKRIDDMIAALKTRGRTDHLGGTACDPRRQIDNRHELSRRALSCARRQGRYRLCRHLGRLCRRSGALRPGRAGFRRTNAPSAHL